MMNREQEIRQLQEQYNDSGKAAKRRKNKENKEGEYAAFFKIRILIAAILFLSVVLCDRFMDFKENKMIQQCIQTISRTSTWNTNEKSYEIEKIFDEWIERIQRNE